MAGSNSTGFGNRPLKSSSNSMLVVFESDDGFESKGFSAQYSMVFVAFPKSLLDGKSSENFSSYQISNKSCLILCSHADQELKLMERDRY